MLTHNIDYFRSKPDDLPKTTILLDNGYHPAAIPNSDFDNGVGRAGE